LTNIDELRKKLSQFAHACNWDQFHSPKSLSMALAAEAAELLEIFQWLTDEQSKVGGSGLVYFVSQVYRAGIASSIIPYLRSAEV
jgi:NTP pyrophosphatase (non-canonical NTP hydrolase)